MKKAILAHKQLQKLLSVGLQNNSNQKYDEWSQSISQTEGPLYLVGYGSLLEPNDNIVIVSGFERVLNVRLLKTDYTDKGGRWIEDDSSISTNLAYNVQSNKNSLLLGALKKYSTKEEKEAIAKRETGYNLVETKCIDPFTQQLYTCYILIIAPSAHHDTFGELTSDVGYPNTSYMLHCISKAYEIDRKYPGYLKLFVENSTLADDSPLYQSKYLRRLLDKYRDRLPKDIQEKLV